jgi:enoyl-CoA hydratase/carnithine racemase
MATELRLEADTLVVRLARPPVNTLDIGLIEELDRCFVTATRSPPAGGIVLTGTGRAFSEGVDAFAYARASVAEQLELARAMTRMLAGLLTVPAPVVAAVNGPAIGDGLALALGCDYRVGVDDESVPVELNQARVGVPLFAGSAAVVRKELPASMLRRLALTSASISMLDMLGTAIDEVAPADDLVDRAQTLAAAMAAQPAFRILKRQLRGPLAAQVRALAQSSETLFTDLLD